MTTMWKFILKALCMIADSKSPPHLQVVHPDESESDKQIILVKDSHDLREQIISTRSVPNGSISTLNVHDITPPEIHHSPVIALAEPHTPATDVACESEWLLGCGSY